MVYDRKAKRYPSFHETYRQPLALLIDTALLAIGDWRFTQTRRKGRRSGALQA